MHRVDTPSAAPDKNGVGFNGFTNGDPQTNTPPTHADEAWFNDFQENLARLVTGARSGLSLVKGNFTQAYDAVVNIATSLLAERLSSDEFIYPVATYPNGRTRTVRIPLIHLVGAGATPTETGVTLSTNSALYYLDLGPYLSSGGYIKNLRMRCNPGAARASASNMQIGLYAISSDTSSGNALAEDDTTTNLQTVEIGDQGTFWLINKATTRYVARIRAGNTAGSNNDVVHYLELEHTALGPRRD